MEGSSIDDAIARMLKRYMDIFFETEPGHPPIGEPEFDDCDNTRELAEFLTRKVIEIQSG